MALKYTRERLATAAHVSSSYDEVVRWFGSTPTPGNRRYVRAKLREAGIDTAHFTPQGVRHTETRLRELVACSRSVAEVVRRLGISPVGGNQAHIGRRIAELRMGNCHFAAILCSWPDSPTNVSQHPGLARPQSEAAHVG
ncbi:hypothetical protein GCM10010211_66660 [Streptomyces albospinus]|uniref:Uncharacterized protein n=1 Tax=Streptomyces albospinus TaxID=285515 RepID=A0ABQ2VMU5_9ACTN|nr:hypothetical protein [Streptomyces albospinus]GGU90668.1 hypothetical protein GCM10010211_66660 [Streptomyces albospinus]